MCLTCVCNLLFSVWYGLVWMRQGSILINTTCAGGELYIKLVCRLTQATCCGFMCVWDGSAGLSDPDSSHEDTLGRIHKSFDQLGPSVEPKLLSQRVGFCDARHLFQKRNLSLAFFQRCIPHVGRRLSFNFAFKSSHVSFIVFYSRLLALLE